MDKLFDELHLPEELLQDAYPLTELGVHERAWSRSGALRVLDHLAGRHIAVLGGDVLEVVDGRPQYAYANWHLDPSAGEDFDQYTARSLQAARDYINRYPSTERETRYVLVLQAGESYQVT